MSNNLKDPEARNSHKRLMQDDVEIKNASYNNGVIVGMIFIVALLVVMVLVYRANTVTPVVVPAPVKHTVVAPVIPVNTVPTATAPASPANANPNAASANETPAQTNPATGNETPASTNPATGNQTPAPTP